jgi:hypothetical protein
MSPITEEERPVDEQLNVGDPVLGKTRILERPCDTCITRPAGKRIALTNERVTEFVKGALASGTFVVCHSTLPAAGAKVPPAVCRGFADRYDTRALRMIRALWGFVEVPVPITEEER